MIGASLLTRIAPRRGVTKEHMSSMLTWAIVGAILGARVFYVIAHVSEFSGPAEWLQVWNGGISLLGGIAGAILINLPRMRKWGYGYFQVLDGAAIALPLGIFIGRIGDLIIGDHLGKPSSWLLAWTYEGGALAPPFNCVQESCLVALQGGHQEAITRAGAKLLDANGAVIASGVGVHQTALYDMLLAGILFGFLWFFGKKERRIGVLTLTFGLYYGLSRVLEDSLRIDKRFGPFTGSQWTALTVAMLSALTLIWWALHPADDAGSGELAAET